MNTLFRNLFIFLAMSAAWAQAAEPAHDHSHATPAVVTAPHVAPSATANFTPNAAVNEALNGEACHMMPGGKPSMGGMSGRPGKMAGGKPCAHCPEPRPAANEHCSMRSSGAASCPKHDAMQQRMKAVERRLDALERAAKSATPSATK